MSAQSLPYPAPSARDEEAQDRTEAAIAFRARQIADQIRADILVPVDMSDLSGAALEAAKRRMWNVECSADWMMDLMSRQDMTIQREAHLKDDDALGSLIRDLSAQAIAAFSEHAAKKQIEAEIKAAENEAIWESS